MLALHFTGPTYQRFSTLLVGALLTTGRWALPVLVDLYRTPEVGTAEGVRHRTPARLMCRLLRRLLTR